MSIGYSQEVLWLNFCDKYCIFFAIYYLHNDYSWLEMYTLEKLNFDYYFIRQQGIGEMKLNPSAMLNDMSDLFLYITKFLWNFTKFFRNTGINQFHEKKIPGHWWNGIKSPSHQWHVGSGLPPSRLYQSCFYIHAGCPTQWLRCSR